VEEKYKIPWTHEAIQNQTFIELLTNYWEDYYIEHPLEAKKSPSGEVVFQTGDPLIDKWEQELAMGLNPDLTEGFSSEEKEKEELVKQNLTKLNDKLVSLEDIMDDFSESYG